MSYLGLARGGQQAPGRLVSQEEEEVSGHLPGEGGGEAPEHAPHPLVPQNLSENMEKYVILYFPRKYCLMLYIILNPFLLFTI